MRGISIPSIKQKLGLWDVWYSLMNYLLTLYCALYLTRWLIHALTHSLIHSYRLTWVLVMVEQTCDILKWRILHYIMWRRRLGNASLYWKPFTCNMILNQTCNKVCSIVQVILMVGLPGAGKSHWVRNHVAANPDKRYNVLSTATLIDKMKVRPHPPLTAHHHSHC